MAGGTRRLPVETLCLALLLACHPVVGASSDTVAAAAPVGAQGSPTDSADGELTSPNDRPSDQPQDQPVAVADTQSSQPASKPEPAPLTAPDGTVIAPCADVPDGMACVPGGAFIRGRDDGPDNERPAEEIWLRSFYMDLHEVRSADFKACVKSKACLRGRPLYNDFSRPDQPIVGPSWYAAQRYCEVQGKHLPTEAQWEKAARGPDGALHPWGDEPATCERAVIKDKRGRSCGVDKRFEHPKKGRTFVVGTRAAGVYGLFDMSGNAWEWVADWASDDYAECGEACRGTDPLGPCDGAEPCRGHKEKVVRGGSWYWVARYATGTHRRLHVPGNDPLHHFGFRCAASLDQAAKIVAAAPVDDGA
ncbi:MAG: SUMF1/EgtB/PvdO family nonheme iron enzyme [Nannocystaceae bacterium]|nr:SUMF1/EgtB/PvdO family nonheme iron enzyme [Nannocystaceae bacterium]